MVRVRVRVRVSVRVRVRARACLQLGIEVVLGTLQPIKESTRDDLRRRRLVTSRYEEAAARPHPLGRCVQEVN